MEMFDHFRLVLSNYFGINQKIEDLILPKPYLLEDIKIIETNNYRQSWTG